MSSDRTPLIGGEKEKPKSNFAASCSNFSIQYNLAVASVAIPMMSRIYVPGQTTNHTNHTDEFTEANDWFGPAGETPPLSHNSSNPMSPLYLEPAWAKMVILGVVFAGAVVGMGGMGYLGDIMGRERAYCLTMFFIVLGSLGAAVLPWGPADDTTDNSVFVILAVVRFVLGVGVGGLYPLSAVKAAESTSEGENMTTRTAKAFFWQTPGAITPYIVGWIIVQMCRNPGSNYHVFAQLEFRLLFGLGAIFPMYLLLSELRSSRGADDSAVSTKDSQETIAKRSQMMKDRQNWKQLIGTAGTWFLFDIAYYGTAIFQPQIVKCIFQPAVGDALTDDFFWHNIVVSLAGIPGVLTAIWVMKHIGARNLGLYGFLLIAFGFGALAICFQVATDTNELKWAKFGIFCFCNFMLNCGPNISTYVLPAVLFPFEVRSTFHGLSAGAGKIGAVVGTFMYPALASQGNNSGGVEHGIAIVLWVQVFFAILGALATIFCLPDDRLLAKQKKLGDTIGASIQREFAN